MGSVLRHSDEPELLDRPGGVSKTDLVGCLAGLERVNRWLGGTRLALMHAGPLIERAWRAGARPVRVCDIGTGSADIPRALAKWAAPRKIDLHITAVEAQPDLAAAARRACVGSKSISVITSDARQVLRRSVDAGVPAATTASRTALARPEPFHVCIASLFLHHFSPDEVADWIALIDGASRTGWVVNDLERHLAALAGIRLIAPAMSSNRVFRHDSALSVRRAFTVSEWRELVKRSGVSGVRVSTHWAFRVSLVKRRRWEGPGRDCRAVTGTGN